MNQKANELWCELLEIAEFLCACRQATTRCSRLFDNRTVANTIEAEAKKLTLRLLDIANNLADVKDKWSDNEYAIYRNDIPEYHGGGFYIVVCRNYEYPPQYNPSANWDDETYPPYSERVKNSRFEFNFLPQGLYFNVTLPSISTSFLLGKD